MKEETKIPPFDRICVTEVIISRITRKGKGIPYDPIRVITEIYTLDGKLICSYDPIKQESEIL